jgi:hypothetical protein
MSESESAHSSPDPRTAEVLRALQRARGMMPNAGSPSSAPGPERSPELPPPREELSNAGPAAQELVESMSATARILERALVAATEKQADVQRGQDRAVWELRQSTQGLKHQADVLADWYAWAVRRVATWGLLLGLLVGAAATLAWRANTIAASTHAILEQILDNQARAQAAKSGKRR